MEEKKIIKDIIVGTEIHMYHTLHPENECLKQIMNKIHVLELEGGTNEYWNAVYCCYKYIIKNDSQILYDIVPRSKIHGDEMQKLCQVAVEENNTEIIDLLRKHGMKFSFEVIIMMDEGRMFYQEPILRYAYKKHGLEIIKVIHDLDLGKIHYLHIFQNAFLNNDTETMDYLLERVHHNSWDELFPAYINNGITCELDMLKFFLDKIDIAKIDFDVFRFLSGSSQTLEKVKLLLDYGLTIKSNILLRGACIRNELDVVEFCLEYGLQVDACIIEIVLRNFNRHKECIALFIKYGVDFSIFKFDAEVIDYDLLRDLENNGLDKEAFFRMLFSAGLKS